VIIARASSFSLVKERDTPVSWATPARVFGAPVRPSAFTAFATAVTLGQRA